MQNSTARNSNYLYQITIIGLLFFIFGFVTWLNSTLIPFLKLSCQLDTLQALFVTFAFYISYVFLAIPSSRILKKTGFKNGMALGLLLMAVGCLVFIPAAQMRAFPLFLTGLFVQGMGLALLQTASNPYISIIGPIESAAQRISIMGICNKVAGILSPLILSSILLKNATALEEKSESLKKMIETVTDAAQKTALESELAGLLGELAERTIFPYVVLAVILAAVSLMIRRSSLPEIDFSAEDQSDAAGPNLSAGRTSVWQFPHLALGALAIFLYVGAEVMAGDVIGVYGKSLGFNLDQTKYFTTFTLASMLLGYVLSIFLIPKYVSQQSFLKYSALLGLVLTALTYFTGGSTAVTCIALLGLANAVMWPAIWPLAINGLGRFTQIGAAWLVMGIGGGALLPLLYGLLQKVVSFQLAFQIVMLPCYAYIVYYATVGSKPR